MSDADMQALMNLQQEVRDELRTELAAAVDKLLDEQADFAKEHLFQGRTQGGNRDGWLCCVAQVRVLLRKLILGSET